MSSPPEPSKIRLGTASPGTQATTAETVAQIRRLAQSAAASHVDILLLPEAYIGGYPRGSSFGSVIGSRSAEGREEFLRYWESAVDLGDTVGDGAGAGDAWVSRQLGRAGAGAGARLGAQSGAEDQQPRRGDGTREDLERIASETGVFLVVGLIEKAGGSLYCAVVYVCPSRGVVGKRRKVMPTGTERLAWAQGSPATLRAVTAVVRGVRVNMAAAICWENYMPLVRQALYAQNINLYLAPTADNRDGWLSLMRTVGIEGRCFVVSSNMCIPSADGQARANGVGDENAVEDEAKADAQPYDGPPRGRRNSAITEDGFEIALPKAGQPRKSTKTRRKSILDEDGNEIVLCCNEEVAIDEIEQAPTAATAAAITAAPRAVSPKTVPAKISTRAPKKLGSFISRGGSSVVSPFGDVLAGPQWEDNQNIIFADVDFKDCIRGRLDVDVAGSYSRNDSFKFSVEGLDLTPLPY